MISDINPGLDTPEWVQQPVPQPANRDKPSTKATMETLEFVIYPDGRVQEKVTGIIGASCAEVTAAIEAQLGQVVSVEKTSDYFDQKLELSATATAQATVSHW